MTKACLILEDGSTFIGKALGIKNKKSFGEVVFNTALSGYQEVLTDPSYAGQLVTLTYPEIGNYGITALDNQSREIFAAGLIIKSVSPIESSWRAQDGNLETFLLKYNASAIYGIDTRALTRKIRSKGAMRAVISTEENFSIPALLEEVLQSPSMNGQDLTPLVSTPTAYIQKTSKKAIGKVVVMDFGLKRNMLTLLNDKGFDLHVLPANSDFEEIKQLNPQGIFLSNGPGDPGACTKPKETIQKLIDSNLAPIFGVCLGHQIMSLALGARTFKLKFGHRGSNHPVKDLRNGRVYITSQNHGFAVEESSLPLNTVRVTHKSLNDDTIEGIEHKDKPIFSVQFHPEACPGPRETDYLFDKFAQLVSDIKPA